MAAFDPAAVRTHPVDYRLVANGFVTLFWDPQVLQRTLRWLAEHGYQLVTLPSGGWRLPADLHRDLARALDFPDYYGRNLDALNDCLSDVVDGDYGWDRSTTGLVLVFLGYDAFARAQPQVAQTVLDIVADRARGAVLIGHRLICLVQSDDPTVRFAPVGAAGVSWNDAEWRDADRG